MRINATSTNFSGRLYLKNQELWTTKMKNAIFCNKNIQEKLQTNDIIAKISAKKEKGTPNYASIHRKGDTVYKVKLIFKKEASNFGEKLKNILNPKKVNINKHYHSEKTTVERLSSF